MANLNIEVREIVDKKTLVGHILSLNGSFQVDAQPELMRTIDELRKKTSLHDFLIDMKQVAFIDNRGINALTTIQENLDKENGRLAYFSIAEKHLNFMKVLNLGKNLKIYDDEEKALFAYYNKIPKKTIPKQFPFNVDCQECSVEIAIPKFGAYKCPRCGEGFTVDKDGEMTFLGKASAPYVQLMIPYGIEFVDGMATLAKGAALKAGFNEAEAGEIGAAFKLTCEAIVKRRRTDEASGHYQILVIPEKNQISFRTSDYSQDIDLESSEFAPVRKVFKTHQRKPHPKGGNLLLLAIGKEN